jgi:hypothetical protein
VIVISLPLSCVRFKNFASKDDSKPSLDISGLLQQVSELHDDLCYWTPAYQLPCFVSTSPHTLRVVASHARADSASFSGGVRSMSSKAVQSEFGLCWLVRSSPILCTSYLPGGPNQAYLYYLLLYVGVVLYMTSSSSVCLRLLGEMPKSQDGNHHRFRVEGGPFPLFHMSD